MAKNLIEDVEVEVEVEVEEEEEGGGGPVEDWDDWKSDQEDSESDFLCLFCDQKWTSVESLFSHCSSNHSFDFRVIRKSLGLNFYDCFQLINYVRSQVAANKCWRCGLGSTKDLQNHRHASVNFESDDKLPWQDDKYLIPFMQDDALLHSFGDDEDDGDECTTSFDKEELLREFVDPKDIADICIEEDNLLGDIPLKIDALNENGSEEARSVPNGCLMYNKLEKVMGKSIASGENVGSLYQKRKDKNLRVSFANVAEKEIKNVNEYYFGAYGSFGIHREMLSDKVRTASYRDAILNNPSLMKRATVMDVGCGTGILSLFAAQAGASRVIAVEASEKMASVATQVVKDNGFFWEGNSNETSNGVITVVHGMVEELDKLIQVPPHSVDVLLSEWMGYCLLYESMLRSVLYARDHWLKPGGAILPDTATIFVAGFGRGGTSIPFWEDVYGFDMSCIGKEVIEDAAQHPIVDIVDSRDLVTDSVVLKTLDLATMEPDEMDLTASFELEPKSDLSGNAIDQSKCTWCYGIVLWFDTGFTSRFCSEKSTILSTSPYGPKTHWSQTIFTFKEPIALSSGKPVTAVTAAIGTNACPAARIESRVSIARAAQHRSIDISLETTAISIDGQKRSWPVQIFNL